MPTNGNDKGMIMAGENDHDNPEDDPMMQANEQYDGATNNFNGFAKPCWPY
jgi:hypothetical protein